MIKLIEMECENCGGALEQIDRERARCPHCDAVYLIDRGQPKEIHVHQTAPAQRNSTPLIAFAIIVVALLVFLVVEIRNTYTTGDTNRTSSVGTEAKEEKFRSEFFKTLVMEIYGASVEEVAEEELRELTSLYVYRENGCYVVEYSRNDGETKQIQMEDSLYSDMADLKNFPNLKRIHFITETIPQVALNQLNSLEEVWCQNTPKDLADGLTHPEKLKVYGCYDAETLDGVDAFTQLEHLHINDYDLADLNAISALTNLRKLEIVNGDAITDFGVLHSLKQLEVLYMDTEQLKDISFVGKMPNLKEFSMKDAIVIDISALDGKTTLKKVVLQDNRELTDYSALSSLNELEELTLELGSKAQMPDASNWTKLHTLSIQGVSDVSFMQSLTGLKTLYLKGADCNTFDVFASLQNLEYLQIGSVYGDLDNLNMLTHLSKLKVLDMSGMTVYGNVEAIFSIASLEEININDCSFGLNFDAIPEHANLKKLHMNRLRLWENIMVQYDGAFTYVDYDDVELVDNIDVVKKFGNLEELYLQGNKLTNISFVESLPNLKKLDITNNYVTDLRPLQQLSQFEIVWCGQNAISQGSDLGADVTVVLDSEEEEKEWWE
ncbi:MAG: leucine-rich repeat domain-containing protein [Lachnospiraceae bacterium]|nr:leucine-rich repeat domain-containing protein [Lachnospiraceae bacterium]